MQPKNLLYDAIAAKRELESLNQAIPETNRFISVTQNVFSPKFIYFAQQIITTVVVIIGICILKLGIFTSHKMALDKTQIAKRISQELRDGMYVNLGIGIPTLVANFVPNDIEIVLQSENGMLGIGPFPTEAEVDADLINAGKQTVTLLQGGSYFDSALSFGMIRAGKVDLTVLGAMEVADNGDIANWKVPGKMVKGMGGAMDLVASAKNIIVAMQHTDKAGNSKLLDQCSLPITGLQCVKKVVTDLGVFEITPEGFLCTEYAPGVTIEEIKAKTSGRLTISPDVKEVSVH